MPILDISRALTPGHPNWPGDAPFVLQPGARIAAGSSVNTGVLSTSTHTGTHVDAPWHYHDAGARLHETPLEVYIGEALLLDVSAHVGGRGGAGELGPELLPDLPSPESPSPGSPSSGSLPPRLLLYTGQPAHWASFPQTFATLSPALVREAARRGVRLIGVDTPSVDPLDSKDLAAHHACHQGGVHILEGLNLSAAPPGRYTLVCLPLPLWDADGAPARAALLPPDGH